MASVKLYTKAGCPFCHRARQLLEIKRIRYQEIPVDGRTERFEEMVSKSGRRTVPQIFINEEPIGGCDDLYALEEEGELDKLLQN
jgi:glutaredoxin 3